MRWSWWRRIADDSSRRPVAEAPGSGGDAREEELRRERLVEAHEDEMRRERLLAEHRREAGSAFPTTPGPLDPNGGWPSALNRE